MRPYSVVEAQALRIYNMIETRATRVCREELRSHHEPWIRAIFSGWEDGKHWRDVDVGDVRWYDMERELETLFEWSRA